MPDKVEFTPHQRKGNFDVVCPPEGSLPPLTVRPGGRATRTMLTPQVTLRPDRVNSLRPPGGTALVIHGARAKQIIACGVITTEQAQQP